MRDALLIEHQVIFIVGDDNATLGARKSHVVGIFCTEQIGIDRGCHVDLTASESLRHSGMHMLIQVEAYRCWHAEGS